MITALEGILQRQGIDFAIIKVGPISLQIYAPGSTLTQMGVAGDKVYLHTYLYVKEDNIALYGFASVEELGLFQHLISVSGIGPKAALGILSVLNPGQLASAIASGSIDLLSQVPGIGKKMAGRLVLELKGKLEKEWSESVISTLPPENADVITALTSLGYSLREATQAVSSLPGSEAVSLEEKVRLALKQLART